jgi:hypothetical protein
MSTFLFSLFVPLMITPTDGAGCPPKPPQGMHCTYVSPYRDEESLIAPLDSLPFQLKLPLLWTMQDSLKAYVFTFDSGLSGSVHLSKIPVPLHELDLPEMDAALNVFCQKMTCWIYGKELQGAYAARIEVRGSQNAMSAKHKAQALRLIKSVSPDL